MHARSEINNIVDSHSNKLSTLQAIRAIAASLVVADHSILTAGSYPKELAWIMGSVGVSLFFVISGFIMAFSTRRDEPGPAASLRFLYRRLLRVTPLYWLFTLFLIGQALIKHSHDFNLAAILKSLFFIPYLDFENQVHPILQQGWTLDYEMLFYLIFSIGLLLPRRLGIACVCVFLALLIASGPIAEGVIWHTWSSLLIILFGAGIGCALLREKLLAGNGTITAPAWPLYFLIGAIVIALWRRPEYPPPLWARVGSYFVFTAIIGLAVCIRQKSNSVINRALDALGDASYSTYLCQNIVIYPVFKLVGRHLPASLTIIVMIILANLAGLIIYRFIERPITNAVKKLRWPGRAVA